MAVIRTQEASMFGRMQTSTVLNLSFDDPLDKYTASIEISNACREFYKARLEATLEAKLKIKGCSAPRRRQTSIDSAMQKLRKEMSELMDQDLSLIKQLLTLNETIEELKWQRKHYASKCSLVSLGSVSVQESDWSVSETDVYESEKELNQKYLTPSKLSLEPGIARRCSFGDLIDKNVPTPTPRSTFKTVKSTDIVSKHGKIVNDEKQNSFDSGIHEPSLEDDMT